METDFTNVWKMDFISRESVLLISALPKCLVHAISKNRSYEKALPKHPYLPVFVIIEKVISILLDCRLVSVNIEGQ